MTVQMKACKNCSAIYDEGDTCTKCGGQLSRDWQGYIVIINPEKSEIAKTMGITTEGRYALKVR